MTLRSDHSGSRPIRYFGAALTGAVFSLFASNALQMGFQYMFAAEDPEETWTMFLWGDHYLLMILSKLLATVIGACVSGVIGRTHGAAVAIAGQVPSMVTWAVRGYLAWLAPTELIGAFHPVSAPYRFACIVLLIATPAVAYTVGGWAMPLGQEAASHFDQRRWTLLGIKWFHYLWLPLFWTATLSQIAYAAFYAVAWFRSALAAGAVMSRVEFVLSVAVASSVVFVWQATLASYRILAGFTPETNSWKRTKHLFRAGFGQFLLGTAVCAAVRTLHWYLATKHGWFK